jgi:hypothetical protein
LKSAVHEMKNSLTAGARKRASELKTWYMEMIQSGEKVWNKLNRDSKNYRTKQLA